MHRLALPLAVLMCTVAVSAGQADKPTAEKPALDKSALEAYVRAVKSGEFPTAEHGYQ